MDFRITSFSREQTNLATLTRGSVLPIVDLRPAAWEYHYFETPDPPEGSSNFPATLTLTIAPSGGAAHTLEDVEVHLGFGGCSEIYEVWPTPPAADGEPGVSVEGTPRVLTITVEASRLYDEWIAARQAKLAEGSCAPAQVLSCAQAGASAAAARCCFRPDVYVAFKGTPAEPDAPGALAGYSYTLRPDLRCQQGFRAAGGTTGTYAEACAPCAAGKFQDAAGQFACKRCDARFNQKRDLRMHRFECKAVKKVKTEPSS